MRITYRIRDRKEDSLGIEDAKYLEEVRGTTRWEMGILKVDLL